MKGITMADQSSSTTRRPGARPVAIFPTPDTAVIIRMPAVELMALAQLAKRLDFGTCERFSCRHTTYADRTEADVMWSAVHLFQAQLAQAGFAPR